MRNDDLSSMKSVRRQVDKCHNGNGANARLISHSGSSGKDGCLSILSQSQEGQYDMVVLHSSNFFPALAGSVESEEVL